MNTFINLLGNLKRTEKNAPAYKSSLDPLTDLFFLVLYYRNDHSRLNNLLKEIIEKYGANTALKAIFALRDPRNGMGERAVPKKLLYYLADISPDLIIKNLDKVIEYGRVDDLLTLLDTKIAEQTAFFIKNNIEKNQLFAKWLPRDNKSLKNYAYILMNFWKMKPKEYRKFITQNNKVVESQMTANKWHEIEYEKVPSRAALIYRNAFSRHDNSRYNLYLEDVANNKAKINTSVSTPSDIVLKILKNSYDTTLELAWKNLKDFAPDVSYLPVIDVSGSMYNLSDSIYHALALGTYFAQKNKSDFRDIFLTFSENPEFVKLEGENLLEILNNLKKASWGYTTNINKVFELILNTIKSGANKEDLPKNILILSDMEFDAGVNTVTNFDTWEKEFSKQEVTLPQIVFWNLNTRNMTFPVTMHNNGTVLLSGYNPQMLGMLNDVSNPVQYVLSFIEKFPINE